MSGDLRDLLERSYPEEPVRPVSPDDVWVRGRRRRVARRVSAAAAGVAVLAAVALGALQLAEPAPAPFIDDPEDRSLAIYEVEPEPLDPSRIQRELNQTPPSDPDADVGGLTLREEILADGLVTPQEYHRAYEATAKCVREQGFTPLIYTGGAIVSPAVNPDHILSIAVEEPPGEDPRDVLDRCVAQWSYHVHAVWVAQLMPSTSEEQRAREYAWECGRERGMELSDPPTEHDALIAITNYDCRPWEALD